jgi:hypothetical protein
MAHPVIGPTISVPSRPHFADPGRWPYPETRKVALGGGSGDAELGGDRKVGVSLPEEADHQPSFGELESNL